MQVRSVYLSAAFLLDEVFQNLSDKSCAGARYLASKSMSVFQKRFFDAVEEIIFFINEIQPTVGNVVHFRNDRFDSEIKLKGQLRNATPKSKTADR